MVIMMANTPELTPEPQDFPPVASTSLLKSTSNVSEGAPPTTDPAINLTVAATTLSMSIGIFEQFIQDYDQQAPHTLGCSSSPVMPTQSEFDLDEKNYKLVLALEHMQYISRMNDNHGSRLPLPLYFSGPTNEEVSQYDPFHYVTCHTSHQDDADDLRDSLDESTLQFLASLSNDELINMTNKYFVIPDPPAVYN